MLIVRQKTRQQTNKWTDRVQNFKIVNLNTKKSFTLFYHKLGNLNSYTESPTLGTFIRIREYILRSEQEREL